MKIIMKMAIQSDNINNDNNNNNGKSVEKVFSFVIIINRENSWEMIIGRKQFLLSFRVTKEEITNRTKHKKSLEMG